jgi:hypothetical protein
MLLIPSRSPSHSHRCAKSRRDEKTNKHETTFINLLLVFHPRIFSRLLSESATKATNKVFRCRASSRVYAALTNDTINILINYGKYLQRAANVPESRRVCRCGTHLMNHIEQCTHVGLLRDIILGSPSGLFTCSSVDCLLPPLDENSICPLNGKKCFNYSQRLN